MAALVDRIPTLESPRERRVHPHVPTSVPFLAMLGVCCTVPLAYHLLGLASHPFPAHTIVSTSMFAVVHALARRTFTPILFVPLIALVCEPYYIHLVLYPLVLMTMMLLEAHNASTLTNVAHDELFIPTGCVFALLAWIYRSGMWAPFPAALAMLLMTTIMYLKYRVRGLHYAAGFAVVSALLFINSLTESPALIERIAQLVVLLFPCIILLDIYMSAAANKTVVPAPPPSDQRAMLLAEISEKIREPLFAINTVLPGLKTGDEGKMRELETNVGLLMQLSQNVMKIVETEGTNQLVEGPFNLRTLIEDTLDAVSLNCTADEIDFIYSLDPDVNLDLIGDQGAVRQVLIELLGYCLKHTPSGEIRISVGLVAPAEGSTVDLAFRVIASGCRGLNPATEVLPLSYCHQLLRILRSQLSMHTSADELKFFFDLRVSINPVPPAEPDDLALSGGGSVLVLDDNKATRLFLSQELSSMGYHVESAADKTDAKRLLQLSVTSVLPYDVIIVDTHMDGVEFITQLKSEAEYSSLTPILMLSPSDRRRIDHIRAIAPQIRQMLQKPIRRSALLHAVRTALSSRVESSLSISRSMSNLNSVRKKKEGARRPSRVLVAEESLSGQAMMREVLNNLGFQTNLVTESAQLAKETLTGAYAAVLVNVSNRKFDPLPAVRQVRAEEEKLKPHDFSGDAIEKSHVPIIAVSELPSEEEKQRCFELAMDGYISKPVDQDVLDSVLKDLQVVRSSKKRLSLSPAVPRVALSPRHAAQSAKQLLEQKLHAYVPKEFQELIAPNKSLDQVQLGDAELRCITIFFSDIRDFTAATEKMYVKDVMKFINAYLAFALPAITTHHGFIDKFIGDAIMALFTQADLRDQAVAAVSAAVKMQRDLDFMHACGFREATTGIGINTGPVIMGFIGTETRMSPTVLGDAVNLASRTEALCKTYGARVLITQHTLRQMAEKAKQFDIRAVDHVTVKGKEEPCKIYEVINGDADELRSKKLQILGDYNRAMDYFGEGKFGLALDLFESCSSSLPTDKPSLLYISRCKQLIASPPAHWDGIYHRTEKD